MLTRQPPGAAPARPAGLRLCSVCDGIEAVMLFAAWFARLPPGTRRRDLSLAEALDHFSRLQDEPFDLIVLVPDATSQAAPRLMEAVISEALQHSAEVLLLLPPKAKLRLSDEFLSRVKVLRGPPFADAADPGAGQAGDPPLEGEASAGPPSARGGSLLGRLLGTRGRGADAATPPPAAPPAPALRPGLRTILVQPVSGGVGATSFAVNLACELALAQPARRVCLIDLNLQFGNVATYCSLSISTRLVDAYRSIDTLDGDAFGMCLQPVLRNLDVFPGPGEILPLDGISPANLRQILALAREKADLVVVDLPHQLPDWSGAAFAAADVIFALGLLDVRSAQNIARLSELMRAESLPLQKILFLLNRVPARRSALWTAALAELEKALGTPAFRLLPEGGEEVILAGNAGLALHSHAPGNVLRKAIRDLARDLLEQAAAPAATETEAADV